MPQGSVTLPIVHIANVAVSNNRYGHCCLYIAAYRATIGPRGPKFFHSCQELLCQEKDRSREHENLPRVDADRAQPRIRFRRWLRRSWQGSRKACRGEPCRRPWRRLARGACRNFAFSAVGQGFFYAPARPCGSFIPPEGAAATRTFLLRESLFNYLLQRFISAHAGRSQGDRSGRTPGGCAQ